MPILSEPALRRVVALRGEGAPPLSIVDVGANPIEGEVSYQELLEAGLCRVTGFEPQPEALAALEARKGPLETYFPDALGDGGNATLHLTHGSGFASVFAADASVARLLGWSRAMKPRGDAQIVTRRLDDISGVGHVDFLKIDVQGAELGIIRNGRSLLSRAVAIQTEMRFLPIYDGEPRFGALDDELASQGFAFHDFVHLKRTALRSAHAARLRRRANRQVVDGDVIYVRDLAHPDRIDDDQLFRLALLALGVLASAGVAIYCLDLLADRDRISVDAVSEIVDLLPDTLRSEIRA